MDFFFPILQYSSGHYESWLNHYMLRKCQTRPPGNMSASALWWLNIHAMLCLSEFSNNDHTILITCWYMNQWWHKSMMLAFLWINMAWLIYYWVEFQTQVVSCYQVLSYSSFDAWHLISDLSPDSCLENWIVLREHCTSCEMSSLGLSNTTDASILSNCCQKYQIILQVLLVLILMRCASM